MTLEKVVTTRKPHKCVDDEHDGHIIQKGERAFRWFNGKHYNYLCKQHMQENGFPIEVIEGKIPLEA